MAPGIRRDVKRIQARNPLAHFLGEVFGLHFEVGSWTPWAASSSQKSSPPLARVDVWDSSFFSYKVLLFSLKGICLKWFSLHMVASFHCFGA